MSSSTLQPILNLPTFYINNLVPAFTSTTSLTISDGAARDSTGSMDIVLGSPTVLNFAVNGLNGLDVGAAANSTFYALYVIADPTGYNVSGVLASTSFTAPALPNGYGTFRLIGYWLTNGSAALISGYVSGISSARTHTYDTPLGVLSAGTATTATAVSLAASVPLIANTIVLLDAIFIPGTAGNSVLFTAGGSVATAGATLGGSVAGIAEQAQLIVISNAVAGVQTILYKNSAASGSTTASVQAFSYSV